MKKRLFAILLIAVILLSLSACGDSSGDDPKPGELSMRALFAPMLSISQITAEDRVVACFGDCPMYLSALLGESETLSADGNSILNESGEVISTLKERGDVFAYSMAACLLNYMNSIPVDSKVLYTFDVYQTDFLLAAGYPDSTDKAAVDSFISDDLAYSYLETFVKTGVDQLIKGDESLREKATNFAYSQLIKDGVLKEDRTFTEQGMAEYKRTVLVSAEYNFLVEQEYTTKVNNLVAEYYSFGAKK